MPQLIFGGLLAVVMLGLYIDSIYEALTLVKKCGDVTNCPTQLSANVSLVFNLIGGLISATVVGVLGSTNRGEFPAKESFKKNLNGITSTIAGYMPSVFILVWIICGVVIVVYGFMPFYNDPVPALAAQAKAWIGTAIAAVYAYIGITPDGKPIPPPAISKIVIDKTSIELTPETASETLKILATDAAGAPINNLPAGLIQWRSDNDLFATVDQSGVVSRVAAGTCNVTATANNNSIVSNNCTVTCS